MSWEPPSYIEVTMSSEIGAYQDDFEERTPGASADQANPAAQASAEET